MYGLLGANGAGKSTTIECVLGTRKADSGSARILGLDPWKDRKRLFEQVGVQFQEANYPDKRQRLPEFYAGIIHYALKNL